MSISRLVAALSNEQARALIELLENPVMPSPQQAAEPEPAVRARRGRKSVKIDDKLLAARRASYAKTRAEKRKAAKKVAIAPPAPAAKSEAEDGRPKNPVMPAKPSGADEVG